LKIHVVGAGAIGGLAGTWMAKAGEDVTFVDANREHVEALRTAGVVVKGARGEHRLPPQKALTPLELNEPLECVFLAVKSQHTREALEVIKPLLKPHGFVVSLQNGLVNEDVIASVVGPDRTIGALPDYGGAYIAPGQLELAIDGPVYVGELDGKPTSRITAVRELLSRMSECHLTADIRARIWAKTCYGARIAATTLVDAPSHDVMAAERARYVVGPMTRERLEVAYACGVNVPAGPLFDPALYFPRTPADTQKLFAAIDDAMLRMNRHRLAVHPSGYKCHFQASGFHWDIVYRHRKSELRWSDGPLEEKAKAVGVPLPLNTRMHQMIYEIEDRTRTMGWHNFDELRELIRALGKELPS
jgi:2-dehydropantoate 2-reductase